MNNDQPFIASGEHELLDTPEYKAKIAAIRQWLEIQYQSRLERAPFGTRWIVRWQMKREFERECAKLVPRDVLFARSLT
ncbi:MAG: hypothetical protein KAX40_02555 [Herpetosiphon sp.]|nr:hypothetical protein [Herpetosiphon sp.]